MTIESIPQILQSAVSPVVLISGVGLLLLTLTNRLGRVTDRARQLDQAYRTAPEGDRPGIVLQIRMLYRRAELLRTSILLGGISVFFVALTVVGLLDLALWGGAFAWLSLGCFAAALAALIGSIVWFLRDVLLALHALRLEVGEHLGG